MHRTLLLCFIHGFKASPSYYPSPLDIHRRGITRANNPRSQGGDDTFGGFPEHLRALLSHALPKITVKVVIYPKFETRGDLKECVVRFREWCGPKTLKTPSSLPLTPPTFPQNHKLCILLNLMRA